VSSLVVEASRVTQGLVVLEGACAWPGILGAEGGRIALGRLFDLASLPLPDPERERPAPVPFVGTINDTVTMDTAPYMVAARPREVAIENGVGRVRLTVRIEQERTVVQRTLVLAAPEVPASRDGELRALRDALREVNAAEVRLKR
jgi:hypothetical protein